MIATFDENDLNAVKIQTGGSGTLRSFGARASDDKVIRFGHAVSRPAWLGGNGGHGGLLGGGVRREQEFLLAEL